MRHARASRRGIESVLVGGPLAFAAGTGAMFGVFEQQSLPSFALTLPEILWEASLGIYLIVKGFKPSPILAVDFRAAA